MRTPARSVAPSTMPLSHRRSVQSKLLQRGQRTRGGKTAQLQEAQVGTAMLMGEPCVWFYLYVFCQSFLDARKHRNPNPACSRHEG
jgi:hypothetical protein